MVSYDYRAVFDATPTPLVVVAPPDWTIVELNAARVGLTGLPRDDQVGRRLFDVFPDDPEDENASGVANLTASLNRVLATRMSDTMGVQRYPVRSADGRFVERWFTPVNTPVLDKDGEVVHIIHRVEDVTELVRLRGDATAQDGLAREQQLIIDRLRVAERTLRESEERNRRIVQGVKDYAVFVTDAEGVVIDWTPGAEAIFGWPEDEILGESAELLFTPEDRAAGVPFGELETARREGCANDERWHLRRDGSRFFANGSVRPLHDQQGDVAGFMKIARDETVRRMVEEQLRNSEEFNRRVLASSADCIKVLNLDGRVEFMSEGGMQVMEVDDFESIDGAYWPGFWPGDAHGDALKSIAEAKAGRTGRFQGFATTMKGSPRWWDVIVTAINGTDGRPRKLLSISRDVTATKQAELGLRELNETLERRVAERTADLVRTQEVLRQSQKMEAMGQLTGGVAHDFNNLLTPIMGCLDLLQRRGVGAEREQRLIDGAMQSAERAKTVVQRLLAFARRQPLQNGPVDLGQLVDGVRELISTTVGPQIDVVIDVAQDLPRAKADANQLEMAILNLSVNARDAMPEGGTLRISAHAVSVGDGHAADVSPGEYVRLLVADTGEGMDAATTSRAIEPFFSTKGVGKGTGLGLSMVHGLVSQLGGGLTIASEPGRGTEIALWLPTVAAEPMSPSVDTGAAPPHRGHGRALLVDDEDVVRASTSDMLADLGYEVTETASAAQALDLVDKGLRPDVIVTDHLMPGMTGTELAGLMRIRLPHTPVLLISGYADDQGVAPDQPRLTKPFRQADLATSLADIVGVDER